MSAGGGEVIRLNIEAGYCPGWRAADGCRELVQNWWDAVRAAAPGGGEPDGGDPDAAVGREQLGARTRFVASVAAPPGGAVDGAEWAATARATTACNVGKGSKDSGGSPRCGGGRADDAGERVPGRLGEILWEGEPSGAQPKGSGELVLWNRGTLGREVLALGNTTKHGGLRAFAGGHGEGLKVRHTFSMT